MEAIDASWLACAIDSEGSLRLAIADRNRRPLAIQITNTHKGFLESAQKRAECGHIYEAPHKGRWKPCFSFNINRHQDVLRVLKEVEPYLIIKKEQANHIIRFIEGYKWRQKWENNSQVIQRFRDLASEGKSLRQIERITGIDNSMINKYMKQLGITITRNCRKCGMRFIVSSKYRYYCENCGYLTPRKCLECGRVYNPNHATQEYCSRSCTAKASWRQRRNIAKRHIELYESLV